jgi:hypothetical protein
MAGLWFTFKIFLVEETPGNMNKWSTTDDRTLIHLANMNGSLRAALAVPNTVLTPSKQNLASNSSWMFMTILF